MATLARGPFDVHQTVNHLDVSLLCWTDLLRQTFDIR